MMIHCMEWKKIRDSKNSWNEDDCFLLLLLSRSSSISTKRRRKPALGLMRPRDLWVKLSILIYFFWSSFCLLFVCTPTGFFLILHVFNVSVRSYFYPSLWWKFPIKAHFFPPVSAFGVKPWAQGGGGRGGRGAVTFLSWNEVNLL